MTNMFKIGFGFMKIKEIGNGGGGLTIHGGNNPARNAMFCGTSTRKK